MIQVIFIIIILLIIFFFVRRIILKIKEGSINKESVKNFLLSLIFPTVLTVFIVIALLST